MTDTRDELVHVKTMDHDDGGCQVCDECDFGPGHMRPCDCDCSLIRGKYDVSR